MVKIYPVVIRRTTGGGTTPAVVRYSMGDTLHTTDKIKIDPLNLADTLHLPETYRVTAGTLAEPDTLHLPETYRVTAGTVAEPDTLHLPETYRVTTGTVAEPDTVHATDRPSLAAGSTLAEPEAFHLPETYRVTTGTVAEPDTLHLPETYWVTTGTVVEPDTLHLPDTFKGTVTSWNVGRSGTPDTDAFGDAWTDGVPLNSGVNHGNEDLQSIATALADKVPFFEFDLTRFVNLSTNGTLALSMKVVTAPTAFGPAIITATFSKFAARPFTESTITRANEPANGTNTVAKTVSVAVGDAGTRKTWTLTGAEYSAFLGNWCMVRLGNSDTAVTSLVVFSSRDTATAADRPLVTFDFKR